MAMPPSSQAASLHARWMRFYDRVGITARLAVPSTLAIVIGVLSTQWWTMGQVREAKMAEVQQSLVVNLAMLKDVLRPLGTTWRVDGDKLLLGDTVINGNTELVDRVKNVAGGVATVFLGDTRVATNVQRPDGTRGVGTRLAPGAAYDAAIRQGQTFQGTNEILGQHHLTVYEPIRDAQGRQVGLLFVGYPLTQLEAGVAVIVNRAIVAGLLVTLVLMVGRVLLLRVTLKPLQHLAAAQRAVASGDTGAKVPFTSRTDEVGNLAKALASMRDDLAASKQAAAAMDAERAAASEARRVGRLAMADDFERRVQGIADDVAGAAERLSGQAEAIVSAIGATESVAGAVRSSADQAAGSVQNVAAAAEELAASISEIGRQVAASAKAAELAAQESRRTDGQVEELNQAATRISDVVRLIGDIAGQTNLLALNATIEAARAGEAGKGFAVVAGEVKNLAGQTAKATEEIGSQIAAMQDATGGAVQAIRAIGARIEEISRLATTVASAVDQQGAATSEIAQSVQQAAANTGEVSAAISQVGDSAATAAQGGAAIRTDAGALSGQAEALRAAVRGLVQDLRAA